MSNNAFDFEAKILGNYRSIDIKFKLTEEQKARLPKGRKLVYTRAKVPVRNNDEYVHVTARAGYFNPEKKRQVYIASKVIGKAYVNDPEEKVYSMKPRNWKQLEMEKAVQEAVEKKKEETTSLTTEHVRTPTDDGLLTIQGLLGLFEGSLDFRDEEGFPQIRKVPVSVLMVVCVLSATRGEFNAEQAADYWNANLDALKEYFPGQGLGTISADSIRRMLRSLTDECLTSILSGVAEKLSTGTWSQDGVYHVALDGQAANSSVDPKTGRVRFHMNMVNVSYARIMSHELIDTKTNEVSAGPRLVQQFNLTNAIVSADALNTTVPFAEAILRQGGHYYLAVKGNVGKIYEDIQEEFTQAIRNMKLIPFEEDSKGHGRSGWHSTFVLPGNKLKETHLQKWPGLRHGCIVKNISYSWEKNGKRTHEVRYFISSYPYLKQGEKRLSKETLELMGRSALNHWGVETTHWHLDLNFKQDDFQCNDPYYLFAVSTIIKAAYNLVKAYQEHEVETTGISEERSLRRCQRLFAPTLEAGIRHCAGLGRDWGTPPNV